MDFIGPWENHPNLGERTNSLLRESFLIADECVRMVNDGELSDSDAVDEFRDLMGQSLDVEAKYLRARNAEFAEIQRRWLA